MRLLAITFLLLAGCSSTPSGWPQPTLEGGQRGFIMSGYFQFSSDEERARQHIIKRLTRACGGPVRIDHLEFRDASGGVNHLYYNVVSTCQENRSET